MPDPDRLERLDALPDDADDEAKFEFGQQLAMDNLLNELFKNNETESPFNTSVAKHKPSLQRRKLLWVGGLSTAACLLVVCGVVFANWVISSPLVKSSVDGSVDSAAAAPSWTVESVGSADFRFTSSDTVELTIGEIMISAADGSNRALTIVTPNSQIKVRKSKSIVGFYDGDDSDRSNSDPKDTGNPARIGLTRILVLSGTAVLSNNSGSVNVSEEQLASVEDDDQPIVETVKHKTEFAINLYQQLRSSYPDDNIVVSPISISSTLAMLLEGARGETAEQIGNVLGLPDSARNRNDNSELIPWETVKIYSGIEQLNQVISRDASDSQNSEQKERLERSLESLKTKRAELARLQQRIYTAEISDNMRTARRLRAQEKILLEEVNSLLDQVGGYQIDIANSIWAQRDYAIKRNYVDRVSKAFHIDGILLADFIGDPESERVRINEWIADQTNQRIQDLLPRSAITADTRIVLANAIYFQGQWESPFDPERTRPRDFTLSNGTEIEIPMMFENEIKGIPYGAVNGDGSVFIAPEVYNADNPPQLYPDDDGFHIVSLPYRGRHISMIILAPMKPDGLDKLESKLNSENLDKWLSATNSRDVDVMLPKFRIEPTYDVKSLLRKMGMELPFLIANDETDGADFSGIVDPDTSEQLSIAEFVHKAFLDVNEKGTEAAAASALAKSEGEDGPQMVKFVPNFYADRPFMFFIRHNETGTVLFMGRFKAPPH